RLAAYARDVAGARSLLTRPVREALYRLLCSGPPAAGPDGLPVRGRVAPVVVIGGRNVLLTLEEPEPVGFERLAAAAADMLGLYAAPAAAAALAAATDDGGGDRPRGSRAGRAGRGARRARGRGGGGGATSPAGPAARRAGRDQRQRAVRRAAQLGTVAVGAAQEQRQSRRARRLEPGDPLGQLGGGELLAALVEEQQVTVGVAQRVDGVAGPGRLRS